MNRQVSGTSAFDLLFETEGKQATRTPSSDVALFIFIIISWGLVGLSAATI